MHDIKVCMFCSHFGWESISEDEYWGKDGGAFCRKGHFYEQRPYDEKDLRDIIKRAETCLDYDPPKTPPSTRDSR